jgi:cytoskeletal protein RodZ
MSSGLDFPITEEDYELPSFILVSGLVVVSTIAYLFWAFLIDAEEIVMDKTNSISAYEETSDEDVASAISQESSEERSMDRPLMNDEALPEETASLISQKTEQKEAAIEEKTKPAGEEEIIAGAVVDMKPLPDIAAPPLYIRGLGQTWLRVTDEDGKVLYSSIILQGETFQLPPEGGIRLDTFDAGKLEYVYEDKTGPRLGKDGENLRGKAISVKSILYSIR